MEDRDRDIAIGETIRRVARYMARQDQKTDDLVWIIYAVLALGGAGIAYCWYGLRGKGLL